MSLTKILVPVKRVVDYSVKVRVKSDKSGVDLGGGIKMSMNPFDEIAVEEAAKMREKGLVQEVVAVSIGPAGSAETLRAAMAVGADRGLHIETDKEVQPLAVAKLLKKVCETEKPNLIIMGKQAIDDDSNQTGQILAGLLNWPQATFASKLEVDVAGNTAKVVREIDGGLESVSVQLPAIVTTDLRLNTPRYAKLQEIMKARKKPLDKKTPADFGVDIEPRLKTVSVEEPPVRKGGSKVKDVDELVDKLVKAGVL